MMRPSAPPVAGKKDPGSSPPGEEPSSSSSGPSSVPGLPVTKGEFPIQQAPMPEPTPEPPVSDAGESDSDAACGDEDALIRLPKIFNVPSLVLLDGDGFVLWLTKQDKLRSLLFMRCHATPLMKKADLPPTMRRSWSVRTSKKLSQTLRHDNQFTVRGTGVGAAFPYGRFQLWIAPDPCTCDRFLDLDFHISISTIQGHSNVPDQVAEEAKGERLTLERCRRLGFIYHASDNSNYESIRERGLYSQQLARTSGY
ncbi:hypothetical protein AK812_SmicGene24617 [Symbiodinium microadriaticum]|uniref:Uncharacterized protein n=1 Tax=Symbiodinium microadriaticum TaxID=2951 RepID=A0A1Q9DEB8_SYMMI|nr:hypothetical protein AK812_SmicGene24617 [Symbiodinium microadriaticum]